MRRLQPALMMMMALSLGAPAASPLQLDRIAVQARNARDQNKLDEALNYYKQGLSMKADWKEGLWYSATILYDQERYPDALAGLKRFLLLEPKSGTASALAGLCNFQLKDYPAAAAYLGQARTLGVDNSALASAALFHFALLLTKFGQYESSGPILLSFALRGQTTPSIIEASGLAGLRQPLLSSEIPVQDVEMIRAAGRAMCAGVERKDREATQRFARLAADYPQHPNVHYLRGSFLLTRDADAAIAEFENELRIDGDHLPALVALAMEYLKKGDAQKAQPIAERAVKVDPNSVAAHAALGKVLTETGPLEQAVAELQAAVRLAPESPQVRIALASAFAKAGRPQDAARERAEFLRLSKLREADINK